MHHNPTDLTYNNTHTNKTAPAPLFDNQHGLVHPHNPQQQLAHAHGRAEPAFSLLLALPAESLAHVTAFLEPAALLALGSTTRYLYEHVKNESTWHRAFLFQFLGIPPEENLGTQQALMLRRTESTWKKEFILRWNLRRRWEKSRTPTVSHIPHHSVVTTMHLMSENALLAASIQYGIVSRSIPLTGKILKGYLDASGTLNGVGIGNPNAEFTPNVSTCAITSEGGTAYILWGFRNGDVAVTTAARAMDQSLRRAGRLVRCSVEDKHEGCTNEVAWAEGSTVCATGGQDGLVKVWNAKTMKCLWTSEKKLAMVPVPCVKVAIDGAAGLVVGGMEDGEVVVWSGFADVFKGEIAAATDIAPFQISSVRVPQPGPSRTNFTWYQHEPTQLFIDAGDPSHTYILVVHANDPYFYRIRVHMAAGQYVRTCFGDQASGAVRSLQPFFSSRAHESKFVIAGDQLGHIGIYDWDTAHPLNGRDAVQAVKKFEAHEDGAVTALACNSTVLVTGSECGDTRVWDSLTFALLKTIAAPSGRFIHGAQRQDGVSQIILQRETVVLAIGTGVMTWKAGPVSNRTQKQIGKSAKKWKRVMKGDLQYEIKRDLKESSKVLEYERAHTRTVWGREKEQRSTLEGMGLSEVEAVEYVLMLSRDEEEQRRTSASAGPSLHSEDEGVFQADFDGMAESRTPVAEFAAPSFSQRAGNISPTLSASPPRSAGAVSPPSLSPSSSHRVYGYSSSMPRVVPATATSNYKVHVSPRARPEPMQANFSASPVSVGKPANVLHSTPSPEDKSHFPPMSRTPSSKGTPSPPHSASLAVRRSVSSSPESARAQQQRQGRGKAATPGSSYSSAAGRTSGSGSPQSVRGAWRAPIHAPPAMATTRSESITLPASAMSASQIGAGPSLLSASLARHGGAVGTSIVDRGSGADDEDADLRLAIELSLAEAISRGDLP